jgi:hypothetical protein
MRLRLLLIVLLFVGSAAVLLPTVLPNTGLPEVAEPLRTDFPFTPGVRLSLEVDWQAAALDEMERDAAWLGPNVRRVDSVLEVDTTTEHGEALTRIDRMKSYRPPESPEGTLRFAFTPEHLEQTRARVMQGTMVELEHRMNEASHEAGHAEVVGPATIRVTLP